LDQPEEGRGYGFAKIKSRQRLVSNCQTGVERVRGALWCQSTAFCGFLIRY
jgi:hypothetical protein